jgi:hypothetical protein
MTALQYLRRILAMGAIIAAVAGCDGVGVAPAVPQSQDWIVAPPMTNLAPVAPALINGPGTMVVSEARQRLHKDLGVQVFWSSDTSPARTAAEADRMFNYVVWLGANSVGIDFNFYTNGVNPTYVYSEPGSTASPATIGLVIANARKHGLRVLVRPLLNEDNLAGHAWRGAIHPVSATQWFASYMTFLKPYFVEAQHHKASSFAVGAELESLTADKSQWATLDTDAAELFSGQLTYAYNWGSWENGSSFAPAPSTGVDAYPPFKLGVSATVPQLTSAWVHWLHSRSAKALKSAVMQEVGIAPVVGAYTDPSKLAASGTRIDAKIQRSWFAAACDAAKETHVAGMYFYNVYNTDQPTRPVDITSPTGSFVDISDTIIRACFASGWSLWPR